MTQQQQRETQLRQALAQVTMPSDVVCRTWREADFPAIQRLSTTEGWPTPQRRPEDALTSWRNSWPALVVVEAENLESLIGFLRAFTDEAVTMYVAELLVDVRYRRRGIGQTLLDTCHYLYPRTRIDLLSTETSESYYRSHGFRYIGYGFRKSYI